MNRRVTHLQARGCDISRATCENRFTTRVNRRPNVPPDWTLAVIMALRANSCGIQRNLYNRYRRHVKGDKQNART